MATWRAATLLVAACVLTACTSTSVLPPAEDWPTRQMQIAQLDNWQFSGKLAVKTGSGADTARIVWQQTGRQAQLILTGPAGWGRATITANEESLLLEKDGQQQRLDLNDSVAIERELGWDMPTSLLPYWIRGIPAPDVHIKEQTLSGGRLSTLLQSGWSLNYEQYQSVGNISLPARITFKGDSASGKILIKQWTLDQPHP